MKTKICTKCKKELPAILKYFHKKKTGKYGLQPRCKKCRAVVAKHYYNANSKQILECGRRWRKNNPDYFNQYNYRHREEKLIYFKQYNYERRAESAVYHKQYYISNREQILTRSKQYGQKHSEKKLEYSKQWQKDNPDKVNARNARRRARKQGAEGSHTIEEWKALCSFFDNCCVCCGRKLFLTRDHVKPLVKDGSDYIENIQPLCRSCNSSKGVSEIDYRKKRR